MSSTKNPQLEKLVQSYNSRAYKLGVLGTNLPDLAPIRNELELQIHASKPDKMVSVDLRNKAKVIYYQRWSIQPALLDLKSRYNQQFHKYQDELIALQETLDSVNWNLSQKDEELRTMDTRIKGLSDRYKEEKEVQKYLSIHHYLAHWPHLDGNNRGNWKLWTTNSTIENWI